MTTTQDDSPEEPRAGTAQIQLHTAPVISGHWDRGGVRGELHGEPAMNVARTICAVGAFCGPTLSLVWAAGRLLVPPPSWWWVGGVVLVAAAIPGALLARLISRHLWKDGPTAVAGVRTEREQRAANGRTAPTMPS